jgi:hypothetical protein
MNEMRITDIRLTILRSYGLHDCPLHGMCYPNLSLLSNPICTISSRLHESHDGQLENKLSKITGRYRK